MGRRERTEGGANEGVAVEIGVDVGGESAVKTAAATMSDEDQEGAEDMMEEDDASRDGDWMVEGRTTSA